MIQIFMQLKRHSRTITQPRIFFVRYRKQGHKNVENETIQQQSLLFWFCYEINEFRFEVLRFQEIATHH